MNSLTLILVLLDVIPEITFAICVFSRFQSNLLSDFRIKSHSQQIRPQFDSIIANYPISFEEQPTLMQKFDNCDSSEKVAMS